MLLLGGCIGRPRPLAALARGCSGWRRCAGSRHSGAGPCPHRSRFMESGAGAWCAIWWCSERQGHRRHQRGYSRLSQNRPIARRPQLDRLAPVGVCPRRRCPLWDYSPTGRPSGRSSGSGEGAGLAPCFACASLIPDRCSNDSLGLSQAQSPAFSARRGKLPLGRLHKLSTRAPRIWSAPGPRRQRVARRFIRSRRQSSLAEQPPSFQNGTS